MPEILLYNEDITVLGSPENVVVQTDFGPQGTRGSQIFASNGDPNIVAIGQTPNLNDLCINIAAGSGYSDLYQYISVPGGNIWTKLFKIQDSGTSIYSDEYVTTIDAFFNNGDATVTIPLPMISSTASPSLTKNNFSIQISIENNGAGQDPISCGFYINPLSNPATDLVISLRALDPYSMPINGSYRVHLVIWIIGD